MCPCMVPLQSGTQISTLSPHTFDRLDNVFLDLHIQCTVMTKFHNILKTFVGVLPCPLEKNSYARHFKGKHGKLYIALLIIDPL